MTQALWKCPACGRKFAKVRQRHSCGAVSVDSHFRGRDSRFRELFEQLVGELRRFGPLRIDAVKSGINLIPKHHLGGVRVLKNGIRVGFLLARRIPGARMAGIQRVGPSAYVHAVVVRKQEDFDSDLLSWLREAYERAAKL